MRIAQTMREDGGKGKAMRVRAARLRTAARLAAIGALQTAIAVGAAADAAAQQWVAAWGSSLQGPSPEEWSISDASIRLMARSTVSGDRVRVRLENTYGDAPLTIGAAAVGLRNVAAEIVAGANRPLRFDGAAAVTIPAGGLVVSDPVALEVRSGQGLAVSLHLPGAGVRSSIHRNALATSYVTAPGAGDRTGDESGEAYAETTPWMHWLSAIEVFSASARGAVVAFGDSITDGTCATPDGHDRWEDVLYDRLLEAAGGQARLGMVNAGIGGNTVVRAPPVTSTPGVERMDRDVLDLAGVTHVVVFLGTNDLRRDATAEQVTAGLDEIVGRAGARGLTVIGATLIPRNPTPRRGYPPELGFGAERNARRHAVNAWIRENGDLDAVLDFDAVMRDPGDRDLIRPIYDCDGIHPNVFGYAAMGRSIDLEAFGVSAGPPAGR